VLSKGGEIFMTEQELLDLFIQERIDMLLSTLCKTRTNKSPDEHERILQAEDFIQNMHEQKRELVENYIERFTD